MPPPLHHHSVALVLRSPMSLLCSQAFHSSLPPPEGCPKERTVLPLPPPASHFTSPTEALHTLGLCMGRALRPDALSPSASHAPTYVSSGPSAAPAIQQQQQLKHHQADHTPGSKCFTHVNPLNPLRNPRRKGPILCPVQTWGKSGPDGRRTVQKWQKNLNQACIVIPPGGDLRTGELNGEASPYPGDNHPTPH